MGQVASFHLISARPWDAPVVLARLATDRRALRAVDGLQFFRLLGTGRGSGTGPSIEAHRSALFAVWRDDVALDRFLTAHPLPARWRSAREHWSVGLRVVRARGAWGGFALTTTTTTPGDEPAGPVAVLTRASIRPGATVAFLRSSRSLRGAARADPGNRAVVGVGEWPIGRLGTFSVWDDAAAARRFAAGQVDHLAAGDAARRDAWFTEELFATFAPDRSQGTWDGIDPVGDVVDRR